MRKGRSERSTAAEGPIGELHAALASRRLVEILKQKEVRQFLARLRFAGKRACPCRDLVKFTIVTGLSGAGRSSALRRLEDLGYYCMDNLMPELIPQVASMCLETQRCDRIAVTVDMRAGGYFDSVYDSIKKLRRMNGLDLDILFLDAADSRIVKRFKEVRRNHPVSGSGEILSGIRYERQKLQPIKEMANHVLDTSRFNVMQLRQMIDELYSSDSNDDRLLISLMSFGYKRGIPIDADMIFDMRFIPNPFWDKKMRNQTGRDREVREYVLSFPQTQFFLDSQTNLIAKLAPHYMNEDKKQLVVGIGCTGGQHRSVAVAEELQRRLGELGMRARLEHRDLALEANLR